MEQQGHQLGQPTSQAAQVNISGFCHPQLLGCMLQVLQGLETYITTEKFLHTLEAASAEWIDLSDHKQQPHKAWGSSSSELELSEVGFLQL
jgi:hypothetical protein